ncbi:Gpi16 subunit, GPI transamidase component [Rhodotorula sp. JG-1b]|nr:Gpi16 subunit, GPI transamidase component [Rhodotorula sp. JG-1b]
MRLHALSGALLLLRWLGAAPLSEARSTVPEQYDERLRLTSFAEGKVESEFAFVLQGPWHGQGIRLAQSTHVDHHSLVPHRLTSLVRQHRISSFELTLSSGRWQPTWPLHLPASSSVPASGIEMTAWLELLEDESELEERQRWEAFTSALGGLFCAGIASEGVLTSTTSPTWAVPFPLPEHEDEHRLYRLTIPRLSAACTESLTPFLSLLPCSSRAGLSSLLNPHRLFDGEFTSIAVSMLRDERDGTVRFELRIGSVQDPVRLDRLTGQLGRRAFSLDSLYGRTLKTACPVAASSAIELIVPSHSVNPFVIEPDLARETRNVDGRDVAVWDVAAALEEAALDVWVSWPDENVFHPPPPSKILPTPPLVVRRLRSGAGQERGRLGVEVINHLEEEIEVVWVETWPWWVRTFVHTLEAVVADNLSTDAVLALDYTPAIARERPTTLQAIVRIPPRATAHLTLAYEAASLWYTEYPADSNRGFSIPGATVLLLPPPRPAGDENSTDSSLRARQPILQLHTPTTLLSMPTPDFSMPYNVIILSSTVIALYFGSVVNGLLRRWTCVDLRGGGAVGEKGR